MVLDLAKVLHSLLMITSATDPEVRCLSASDEGIRWYNSTPGQRDHVLLPAMLHVGGAAPSKCPNLNDDPSVQHIARWSFLTGRDASAHGCKWGDPLRKLPKLCALPPEGDKENTVDDDGGDDDYGDE